MFKESIRFPMIFFIVSTFWQFIAHKEIYWMDNIGVVFIMFLLYLFYNWAKVPYKWKKDKAE